MTGATQLDSNTWRDHFAALLDTLGVEALTAASAGYETARLLYNRMHDLRPAFIVRTLDAKAIAAILAFAGNCNVPLALRGGGHHIAGFGSCDGGIVIDFSTFRNVRVDVRQRIVEVEPGATLGDVDEALSRHGLVVPTGTVSGTGIAGLTLGGGIGWLVGYYGLTCDHLVGADLVTGNGELVRAEDDPDLLWALRGGGGNFGAVIAFRYNAHELPHFLAGSIRVPANETCEALQSVIKYMVKGCPPALTVAPTLSAGMSGTELAIDFCLAGYNPRPVEELQNFARGTVAFHKGANFASWQAASDHLFEPPMRGYWKSRYSTSLPANDIDTIVGAVDAASAADVRRIVTVEHLHGKFRRQPEGLSAFPLRGARFGVLIAARWPHPALDEIARAWVRATYDALDPQGVAGAYSNYSHAEDDRCLLQLNSADRDRLAEVKRRHDPSNLFCRNHNVAPTANDDGGGSDVRR